ncbi:coenzyme F430 synthase [Methanofervidicoccus sp. A16]|uniref:coenzyme F430 synthase n=1 Tax=Methanofervidicoccus sp. A16 TaxID=2607662 RepID=UPI00209BC579|nr:coenzyme F430 synthase [Methanofervidicoccus sp. A16]
MILLIDINHGALDVAKEYYNLGYRDIHIWDIYGKLEKDRDILKKYNDIIKYLKIIPHREKPDISKYEEVIAPIHCPINCRFTSFHHAISKIIREKYGNIHRKFIEITGVKGKTTTTELISHILSKEYEIFINNSNRGSITPVSVLKSIDKLYENDILDNYDLFIFEVSLGITSCRYGALINVLENYPIGRGLRDALFAKMSSMKLGERVYINREVVEEYFSKVGRRIEGNVVEIDKKDAKILSKYPLKYRYKDKIVEFNRDVFGVHYVENSLFAIEICKNFLDMEDILDRIYSFKIRSRMNIRSHNPIVIENINPGLDVRSIDYAIRDFKSIFNEGVVVIGGDFGCTCEEIDTKKLGNILSNYRNYFKFILVGPLGRELREYINGEYLENLEDIYRRSPSDNMLIIYRKSISL